MTGHHFICYSPADTAGFAQQLYDALWAESIPAWLDQPDLHAGLDWDEQLLEAIRACRSLLFIMTRDSVEAHSVCKQEWGRALAYKKPIVPLRLHPDAEMPLRLGSRQYIDFTGKFKTGLARLHQHLRWLDSPEGQLQELKDRLAEAQRDLRRTRDPHEQARIRTDIDTLKQQIAAQQQVVDHPEDAARRVEASIQAGLERERQPEKPASGRARSKFINPPPAIVPTYFQDRDDETRLIGHFLSNEAQRLLTIVGRGGIGKTALVCRLLKALESGRLPDDGGDLPVDGIVYLSATGSRRVNLPNLYADLSQLLPAATSAELETLYKNPHTSPTAKMQALLAAFPPARAGVGASGHSPLQGRVVLLLDNFEDVIDPDSRTIADAELAEALRASLDLPSHSVKIIITTRLAARNVALVHPEWQFTLSLDEGLESPYAENILREMDADGKLGLRDASAELLAQAKERTRGYPRALEALFAILSADRHTRLEEILAADLPANVTEALVGEAFNRLDSAAQQVMQALAIYGRPVTSTAVDYLLQPYTPSLDSAPILNRLVNMQFVRKEAGRYYLHPVDSAYALGRVPESLSPSIPPARRLSRNKFSFLTEFFPKKVKSYLGTVTRGEAPGFSLQRGELEGDEIYTEQVLYRRGADYFKQTRQPRGNWKTLADLAPQLAEFHLRCAAGDYDTAAEVLEEIDFDYLLLWGHYRLMVELHEQLQGKLNDPTLKQNSVGNLGTAYTQMGQVQKAINCHEQALAIARAQKNPRGEEAWLGNLGNCYANLGQTTRAIDYYEQALAIARGVDDRQGEGTALGNLGICYATLGQTTRAINYHEQALAIAHEIGDRKEEGRNLGRLGNCYTAPGQTALAIQYQEQALTIAREIGDRQGEGILLDNLGNCYANLGQTARAIDYYEQALTIAREIGDRQGESTALGNLGNCYSNLDQTARAIDYYEQALTIAREIGDRLGEANDLGNLGLRYAALGQIVRAIDYHEEALAISREIGNRNSESFDLSNIGDVLVDQSDWGKATQMYSQALQIADEIGLVTIQNFAPWGLALAHLYAEDLPAARAAVEAARQYDEPQNNHNVLALLGLIALRQGDQEAAQEAFTAAIAQADQLLAHTAQNYEALDAKGLALCGLVVMHSQLEGSNVQTFNVELDSAIGAYRAARAINRDAGYVGRVLRLLDALAVVDSAGVVAGVRAVAAGEA